MITQTIKRWLRKMFAWWPWRQAPPVEYKHVGGQMSKGTPPDGVSLSTIDGTSPQTSITPRLSTIEERPERLLQTPFPTVSDLTATPLPPPVDRPGEPATEDISPAELSTPTPQQRLEFLRYLVKRGIVNEGLEEK